MDVCGTSSRTSPVCHALPLFGVEAPLKLELEIEGEDGKSTVKPELVLAPALPKSQVFTRTVMPTYASDGTDVGVCIAVVGL